ncbi:MAG: cytidine/deoxycytidylate deaminase family protein [Mailhella sp.]|nr:cytidine/deoxycytidylate deaminase family protein [Mailhella sp.]
MRDDWTTYFMDIAHLVAQRSTCLRRKVGAVAVKDKRIVGTGYNGAPSGMRHCAEVGCLRKELGIPSGQRHEICRAIHAEQNVIIEAARFGISLFGAELYCTTLPCLICAKMLVNCGIRRVFYREKYDDQMTLELFNDAGIELVQINMETDDGRTEV